jgi:hypothetical protein
MERKLFLRNPAIAFACLAAVTTMFSGCEPEDDPDNSADNALYFDPDDEDWEQLYVSMQNINT